MSRFGAVGICLALVAPATSCFATLRPVDRRGIITSFNSLGAAKGFGGGRGFESSSSSNSKKNMVKKSSIKQTQQNILKKYGGDIAQGTQLRVEQAMSELPSHLQLATQLYQQLQKWNAHLDSLSLLQQANISEQDLDGARRAQQELERLYRAHNFTEHDLHNIFQRITWDASADAKAVRAITRDMPQDISNRVDRACAVVAKAVNAAGQGRCLDVGCGFGVLVPHLLDKGIAPSQIYGIDLSSEMIRNAREQHRGVMFEVVDFIKDFQSDVGFDGIIFCSALHDLSDSAKALQKAASLLRPNGKLVICHPQGASHVLKQSNANRVLVKRGLPTAEELRSMDLGGLTLETEPAAASSEQESNDGYLAVLSKA